jgi:hypothetical protein
MFSNARVHNSASLPHGNMVDGLLSARHQVDGLTSAQHTGATGSPRLLRPVAICDLDYLNLKIQDPMVNESTK